MEYTKDVIQLNGHKAYVYIKNKIYGNQKIIGNCTFFETEDKIGVKVGGRRLYLYRKEIKNICIENQFVKLVGDIMAIEVEFL